MNHNVVIRHKPGDDNQCIANPDPFIAFRKDKDTVTFLIIGEKQADITFPENAADQPFGERTFELTTRPNQAGLAQSEPQSVRSDAQEKRYKYEVTWRGGAGKGNGSGEVKGSRG